MYFQLFRRGKCFFMNLYFGVKSESKVTLLIESIVIDYNWPNKLFNEWSSRCLVRAQACIYLTKSHDTINPFTEEITRIKVVVQTPVWQTKEPSHWLVLNAPYVF